MIGLFIVAGAGIVLGFVSGLVAGLWTCGRDEG